MPVIRPSYFNFVATTKSTSELQGASGSLNILRGGLFGNYGLGAGDTMSDNITYSLSNGTITISTAGTYEMIISLLVSNKALDDTLRLLVYKNGSPIYMPTVHHDGTFRPEQNTFRHIAVFAAGAVIRFEIQVDGDGEASVLASSTVTVHRLLGHHGSVTLSGSTRLFKHANPLTGNLLMATPPTIVGKTLDNVGYDDTHGRLISSGSDVNLMDYNGKSGLFNFAFNYIRGSGSTGYHTSISCSQNDTVFYSADFFGTNFFDPGPARPINLLRPMNGGDYISLFIRNYNSSEADDDNTLEPGACFSLYEVGHGRAHISLSISSAGTDHLTGGVSRQIAADTEKNVWKIHDSDVWGSNTAVSASVTTHIDGHNITWDPGAGTFTPKYDGIYYLAALTDIRNNNIIASPKATKRLKVGGVNFITSSETELYLGENQRDHGSACDFITLVSCTAGQAISVTHESEEPFKFGQGTSLTMYRLGQEWISARGSEEGNDEPAEKITSDYTLNTYETASKNNPRSQHKKDVEQSPYILSTPGPLSLRGRTRWASHAGPDGEAEDAAGVRPFSYKKISKD